MVNKTSKFVMIYVDLITPTWQVNRNLQFIPTM